MDDETLFGIIGGSIIRLKPFSGLISALSCPTFHRMSVAEIIREFKALPAKERAQVAKVIVEDDDSWIPESFKEGMKAAEEGRLVDMETALFEPPPPHLR